MARYFVRPKQSVRADMDADWWAESGFSHIPTVCDHEATDTGLLDANGDPIMRAPNPIGFGRNDEW